MKFLILGGHGFVGAAIARSIELTKDSFSILGRDNVIDENEKFDVLIDATSQKNDAQINELTYSITNLVEKHSIKQIVVLSSFSTLQSSLISERLNNFGAECSKFTPYTIIKHKKEEVMTRAFDNSVVDLFFIYLPIITGVGGAWGRILNSSFNYTPKVEFCYYIKKEDIFSSILNQLALGLKRATAFEVSDFSSLFSNNPVFLIDKSEFINLYSGFIFSLFSFKNKYMSSFAYFVSFIFMKIKYWSFSPSFFYWYIFYIQNNINASLEKFNVIDVRKLESEEKSDF